MKNKYSILVVGIDEDDMYEIIFVNQGSDGSFYYGFCDDINIYGSRHASGVRHMKVGKQNPITLGKGLPLKELNHFEQLQCYAISTDLIKGKGKLNYKRYNKKKVDGIFTIDLRKFGDQFGLSAFLIPNNKLSEIGNLITNKWYKNGEFYLFMKSEPKILIVAYKS